MTLPDHETWEDQVELTDSKEYPVEVELKPVAKMASLKVLSTPSGAEVSIDGTPKGTTPSDMVLPLGAHSVQISLPEYEKWEDRIQLEDAKEITVELQPLVVVYSLDVSSAPSGAEVTVDEKPEGTTPLNLKMRPGTYMIKVHLSEHQEWKKNLQIKDKDFALKADLIPLPKEAYINASSSPNGATVYVDGKPRGTTPLKRLSVSPGSHKIRLSLGGYNSSESKVTLKASQEHSIDVTLTKVARGPGTGSTASSGRTGSSGSPGSSGSSGGSTGNGWVIKDAIDK
jgi:hypothetical protein